MNLFNLDLLNMHYIINTIMVVAEYGDVEDGILTHIFQRLMEIGLCIRGSRFHIKNIHTLNIDMSELGFWTS